MGETTAGEVELRALRDGTLQVDATFEPGVHVLLGNDKDGPPALMYLLAGLRRPRSGQVLVGELPPYDHPEIRRRIGSLLPAEPDPLAARVEDAMLTAFGLRQPGRERELLKNCLSQFALLSELVTRSVEQLSRSERRAVSLALALSVEAPVLLALHSPLSDVALPQEQVRALIRERAEHCPVVLSSSDVLECSLLNATGHVFENGRRTRVLAPDGSNPGGPMLGPRAMPALSAQTLTVVSPQAAELATELLSNPRANGVRLIRDGEAITLAGTGVHHLAQLVLRAVTSKGISVRSIDCAAPSLLASQAAITGHAQAVFDAAYRASQQAEPQPVIPVSPPPPPAPSEPAPAATSDEPRERP